jgi:hypothetical protein
VDATAQVIVAHYLGNKAADQDALTPLLRKRSLGTLLSRVGMNVLGQRRA